MVPIRAAIGSCGTAFLAPESTITHGTAQVNAFRADE
jgi:alpha-D-ribose 1-methylphosphonate 5-triphosphate synthase subunit PhnG